MIDFSEWTFSVIYSVDVPRGVKLTEYTPPDYGKHWVCTDRVNGCGDGEEPDYSYLDHEGSRSHWRQGRHRKHCAILTFDQFCNFIDRVGLYVKKCGTMGSLGAPGYGIMGWAPAVPFHSDDEHAIQSAYVTPNPPERLIDSTPTLPGMPDDIADPVWDWDEVEKLMWEWFDDGGWSARDHAELCN